MAFLLLAGAPSVPGCTPSRGAPAAPTALFTDMRPQSGVDFRTAHDREGLTILETLGHGAGLCDFDADGNLDLVLVGHDKVGLYRGNGKFGFENVTAASGLKQKGYWLGVATGDWDGDGRVDLFLSGYDCSRLYRNVGGMRFEDATARAGVDVQPPKKGTAPEWRSSAAFVDVDRDGKLDLYVLRYAHFGGAGKPTLCKEYGVPAACDPLVYDSQIGVFYRNLGNGRFQDETAARGLQKAHGHALGLACADYDQDGWIDIAVANDERPGDLFRNLGGGRFQQRGPESGTGFDSLGHTHAGMGIDWGDYDRDGRLDLFVTTFRNEEKTLYRNIGDGTFLDMALRTGLSETLQPWISWGTRFLDYDNDGWLDLMVASGHVHDLAHRILATQSYPQPLKLYRNTAGTTYADVSAQAGSAFAQPFVGRALCTGDIDNDGGLDVVVTDAEGQPRLLRNTTAGRGHWLSVRLEGPPTNRLGIGSTLIVETPAGKKIHNVTTTGSFLSANDARAHIGLGSEASITRVTVRWPDGTTREFGSFGVDREIVLPYGRDAAPHAGP